MHEFWQYVYTYRFGLLLLIGNVVSAAIVTMPPPEEKFAFYPWFYRWMHQLLNLKQQPAPPTKEP